MNATIDALAAEWCGRRDRGLTAAEEAEFQTWLAADSRHPVAYAECDDTWATMDLAGEIPSLRQLVAPKPKRFRFVLPALLAAAAAVVLALYLRPAPPAKPDPEHFTVATDDTAFRKVDLPDGSTIHVNAGSAVTVALSSKERRIELNRGEAFFQVSHDAARPFIVSAKGISVRAVGTAFNVALSHAHLDVLVTEGKVRVEEQGRSVLPTPVSAEPPVLSAGERVSVNLGPRTQPATVAAVAAPEATQALAWQAKQLEFEDRPLAEVVAEFNRYNRHQLVIADPALGQRLFNGTFRADHADVLVDLLIARFGVAAERTGDQTVLHLQR